MTWAAINPMPIENLPFNKFSTTSIENAEKVVKLPRNPVTKKSFHSEESEGKDQKTANNTPIIKQPK